MKQQLTSKQLNRMLSKRAAKTIQAEPNACWQNAYRSLMELPELAKGHYWKAGLSGLTCLSPLSTHGLSLRGTLLTRHRSAGMHTMPIILPCGIRETNC